MDVIFPEMQYGAMENVLQTRVALRMAHMKLNQVQTAKRAGLGESFVRDILRGRTQSPQAKNLSKLAVALGTSPEWLLGESDDLGESGAKPTPDVGGLEVVGVIQAGTWLDTAVLEEHSEVEIIPVARDQRFPNARQYSLRVAGDSMNLEYPDGSFVTCVDYAESGIKIKQDLIVHVERHNGSLVEVTLKAISFVDGRIMLLPRSSNDRHKPIELDGDEGTEIVIKGVVTGSYRRTNI